MTLEETLEELAGSIQDEHDVSSYQPLQLMHLSQETLVPVSPQALTERNRLTSGYQILLANRNKVTYSG